MSQLKIQDFIQAFREEFCRALGDKTSWGRNDIKLVFEQCLNLALARYVEALNIAIQEAKGD